MLCWVKRVGSSCSSSSSLALFLRSLTKTFFVTKIQQILQLRRILKFWKPLRYSRILTKSLSYSALHRPFWRNPYVTRLISSLQSAILTKSLRYSAFARPNRRNPYLTRPLPQPISGKSTKSLPYSAFARPNRRNPYLTRPLPQPSSGKSTKSLSYSAFARPSRGNPYLENCKNFPRLQKIRSIPDSPSSGAQTNIAVITRLSFSEAPGL